MLRRLPLILLLLLVFAIVELYLLLLVGAAIGAGATLGLLLVSAVIGFQAGKAQGLGVFRRWVASNASGDVADEGLVDGLLVLTGSLLLIVPGVISEIIGLVLLIPPARRRIAERVRLRAAGWIQAGSVQVLGAQFEADQRESGEEEGEDEGDAHAGPLFQRFAERGPGRASGHPFEHPFSHDRAAGRERDDRGIEVIEAEGVLVEEKPTKLLGP